MPDYPLSRIVTPLREDNLLIKPSMREGSFDSLAVDCPFVFTIEGRLGMTYVGWDGVGYQTALTWSDDGENWTPGQVIFARDPKSDLREFNAALTSIVRENGLWSPGSLRLFDGWYYGTFHAYPAAGYEAGPGLIGFARSRDLLTWEECGNPLRPEDGGDWESGGLYKSWLLEHDGLFYLYYNAKDTDDFGSTAVPPNWIEQTGLATSPDLNVWTRHELNPVLVAGPQGAFDEIFASDPCVLRDGDMWVMFYFGLAADGHAREGFATSIDLVNWVKSGVVLLDVGAAGSIDSIHTHKPAIIARDGRLEHYYCAVAPGQVVSMRGYEQREQRGIARATGVGRQSSVASEV